MFRLYRNVWPSHPPGGGFRDGLSSCASGRIQKAGNTQNVENRKDHIRNKGGRPRKAVKKDQLLGVKCSLIERRAIEARAKSVNLSVSEYLREMALTGKIDRTEKALPKEVLQFDGKLNHLAANMNQTAKKRNSNEELNALERANLQHTAGEVKQLVKDIKAYLQ
jgi:hypothetical protein